MNPLICFDSLISMAADGCRTTIFQVQYLMCLGTSQGFLKCKWRCFARFEVQGPKTLISLQAHSCQYWALEPHPWYYLFLSSRRIHGNPLLQGPIPSSLFNSPSIEAMWAPSPFHCLFVKPVLNHHGFYCLLFIFLSVVNGGDNICEDLIGLKIEAVLQL